MHTRAAPNPRLILLTCLAAPLAQAAEQPLWEFGAGIGVLSLPDYRGSDQRHSYVLPLPYLVYRGDAIQIDRDKARGVFFKGKRSEWDISLGATVPVKSDSDSARIAMPNLDPTVEIGPQWSYILRDDWVKATLRLPLRKVLAVDFPNMRGVGAVFTPTLALDRSDHPWPGWHASLSTGPLFGDRGYFAYYYGVSPDQATPERPAWQAQSGYGGWQLTATLSQRYQDVWVGGFLRGDYLGGAACADSPLVREKASWMGGVGISWIFSESRQSAGSAWRP